MAERKSGGKGRGGKGGGRDDDRRERPARGRPAGGKPARGASAGRGGKPARAGGARPAARGEGRPARGESARGGKPAARRTGGGRGPQADRFAEEGAGRPRKPRFADDRGPRRDGPARGGDDRPRKPRFADDRAPRRDGPARGGDDRPRKPRFADDRGPRRDGPARGGDDRPRKPRFSDDRGPRRDDDRGPPRARREDGERSARFGGDDRPRKPRFNDDRGPRRDDDRRPPRARRDEGEGFAPRTRRDEGEGFAPRARRTGRDDFAPRKPRAPRPEREERAVLVEDSFEAGAEQADELRLHGVNACLAAVAARGTEGILRAYFSESTARRHFGALMRELAEARRAYHLVSDDELNRITGSTHHEGVCLVVEAQAPLTAEQWLEDNRRLKQGCVLALEGVGNPHNLGAILRVCAHFGIEAVMVPEARVFLSGAAIRTAEGGAENVTVLDAPAFHDTLQAFRAQGWKIVATSSHTGRDLYKVEFPPKTVLLFGEESAGLSGRAISEGDQCVRIPGTGKVESLNVSVAAGVLLGEWWRQIKG